MSPGGRYRAAGRDKAHDRRCPVRPAVLRMQTGMEGRGRSGGSRRRQGAAYLAPPSERERLLEAMAAACAERGYMATSIEDVLTRAGLSRDEFDRQFASKEECGLAALDLILVESDQALDGAANLKLSDWERLLHSLLALLELLAARPSFARLACLEARAAMPSEAYERYRAGIDAVVAMLERARRYAAPGTPANAPRAAIGGAESLVRRELIADRADRLPELLPDIVYGAIAPFTSQAEALRYADLARQLVAGRGY